MSILLPFFATGYILTLSGVASVLCAACLWILFFSINSSSSRTGALFLFFSGAFAFIGITFSSIFSLFIAIESSTIIIIFALLNQGPRQERWLASGYMLFLNICPSSLHLAGLAVWLSKTGTYSFLVGEHCVSVLLVPALLLLFSYAANAPSYGLHQWLPNAHVEADTPTSMMLGGISLNMGWYGASRICLATTSVSSFILMSYLLAASAVATYAGVRHPDMNCVIAYCSVVHITLSLFLLSMGQSWAVSSSGLVVASHCFSCPALFFWAGNSNFRNTLSFSRSSPRYSISAIWIIISSCVIAAGNGVPPFSTFLGEARLVASCLFLGITPLLFSSFGVVMLFIIFFLHLLGLSSQSTQYRFTCRSRPLDFLFFFSFLLPLIFFFFGGTRLILMP